MNNEVLVKVEGVFKKFCRNLKRSLWYGVKNISSELFNVSKKVRCDVEYLIGNLFMNKKVNCKNHC